MVDLVAAVVCESWSCGGKGWFRRPVVKAFVLSSVAVEEKKWSSAAEEGWPGARL